MVLGSLVFFVTDVLLVDNDNCGEIGTRCEKGTSGSVDDAEFFFKNVFPENGLLLGCFGGVVVDGLEFFFQDFGP